MRSAVLVCGLVLVSGCGGGGDDAPGVDGGACACDFGERCVQNVCTPARSLSLNVGESDGTTSAASGCFFKASVIEPLLISETEDGPCTTSVYAEGNAVPFFEPRNGGQLRIEGTLAGTLTLAENVGAPGCFSVPSVVPPDLFATGALLRFVGTGGVDLPAFSVEVEAPSPIQFTAGTVVPGQPHPLTWTGAAASRTTYTLFATASQQSTYVFCRLPDTGSFTVPASVTSLLPAGTGYSQSMGRSNHAHVEPEGSDTVIDLSVTTFDTAP